MKQGSKCFEIPLLKKKVFYYIQLPDTIFQLISFVVFLKLYLAVDILEVVLKNMKISKLLTLSLPLMSNAN